MKTFLSFLAELLGALGLAYFKNLFENPRTSNEEYHDVNAANTTESDKEGKPCTGPFNDSDW